MRRSPVDHARATPGRIASIFPALLLSGLILCCATHARAQDDWTGTNSRQWNDPGNWSSGVPNSTSVSVVITNTTNNPVEISGINPTIANLTLTNSANSLTVDTAQGLTMDGSGGSTISNAGNILLSGVGSNAFLTITANTMQQGVGTMTMSAGGGGTIIEGGATLTNNSTIQGNGLIGNGLTLVNQPSGTVNANVSGGTLYLSNGPVTNAGLLEASGGGILQIGSETVNNAGGNITANSGSTVQLVIVQSRVGR